MTEATGLIAQGEPRVANVTDGRSAPASSQPQTSQSQASQATQPSSDAVQQPQCDYRACASRRSFRPSDCTYQPYSGPRRSCEISERPAMPPEQASQPPSPAPQSPAQAPAQARAQGQCNMDVCSRFYSSFNASDCTYQPYGGGSRRVCDR